MPTLADVNAAVEAPAAVPYRYGLFSVVTPQSPLDSRWEMGIEWESHICGGVRTTTMPCVDPTTDDLLPERWCKSQAFDPFAVYAFSERSTGGGGTQARREQQSRDRLVAGEQAGVEIKLRSLLAAAVPSPVAVSVGTWAGAEKVLAALGWVEQRLTETYPSLGAIVVDRFTAVLLSAYLHVDGGHLATALGTPVAAITNVDDGPNVPTAVTIYGTGPLVLYRGALDSFASINRAVNDVSVLTYRPYVVGWDCTAVGATVTL